MRAREALPDRLSMHRRTALVAAAVLSAVGFVLALLLARQHAQAHAGVASFCAINDYVNCDRVATSRYSVVLGLPVAVWGALGYGVALLLALAGLAGRRREGPPRGSAARSAAAPKAISWPAGLLVLVAGAAAAAAVVLAVISEVFIGALCLLCAGSWLTSFALLAAAWRACRPEGVARAVRADLSLLRERPLRAAALGLALVALVFLVASAYPRYWARPAPRAAAPGGPALAGPAPGGAPASQGPIVVVEFSDYECPFCAVAHEQTKVLLSTRPDVRLVRRHFPLDSDCNPAVTRRMHPKACALARAGICAEAQERLEPMDDALFRNQKAGRPVEELARAAGLDLARFRACLGSSDTEARLRSDIEAGVRAGLQATPTYVVGGRAHAGQLTPDLLPPPRAPGLAAP